MRTRSLLTSLILAGSLVLGAACGDDDGAGVRETGTGTGSATGTGAATGAGTGTGTGSGTGVAGGCEPVGDLASAQTRVDVTLDEWVIDLDADSAPAGAVGFVAQNEGEEPHELIVIEGVAAADLPLEDGALNEEELPDGSLIGEIEAFPAGTSCNGVFDLTPGEYTLVCNVVDEEHGHVHLEEGMVTSFTVT
jgi:hypothetical protein